MKRILLSSVILIGLTFSASAQVVHTKREKEVIKLQPTENVRVDKNPSNTSVVKRNVLLQSKVNFKRYMKPIAVRKEAEK